jgi:hypothetical protein
VEVYSSVAGVLSKHRVMTLPPRRSDASKRLTRDNPPIFFKMIGSHQATRTTTNYRNINHGTPNSVSSTFFVIINQIGSNHSAAKSQDWFHILIQTNGLTAA